MDDTTERFVQAENIRLYAERLCTELMPDQRDLLRRLLTEEVERSGPSAWQLDLAQRYVVDGRTRIAAQQELIARLWAAGEDTAQAVRQLENLRLASRIFADVAARAAHALRNGAG